MADVLGRDARAGDRFGNYDTAKLPGRDILQAATKVADRRSRTGQDHNVFQDRSFQRAAGINAAQ